MPASRTKFRVLWLKLERRGNDFTAYASADGAFWSPFAPTVHGGRPDTDLLLMRQRLPLDAPTRALMDVADANPAGTDTTLNIR